MTKIFLTADTHFNHKNIIGYCQRPFRDVYEMNYALVKNWNSVVSSGDIVYHLGDFGFDSRENELDMIRGLLNGYIVFIKGNHDKRIKRLHIRASDSMFDELALPYCGSKFYMSHCPKSPYVWEWSGCIGNICGHVHNEWKYNHDFKAVNVGVDVWDYRPVELRDVVELWRREQDE